MLTSRLIKAIMAGALGVAWASPGRADNPTRTPAAADARAESARAAEAVVVAKAEAGRYRFGREGGAPAPLALQPGSLLQWSNPVAGSIHGSVFIWTDRGRPAVAGSVYKFYSPEHHIGVEFHSLSRGPLTAHREGRLVWSPTRPGVEFGPIPGAATPADSAAGRLRQLRDLAKEFAATETTRTGVGRELRLLTRPIYRYDSTDPEVPDGGLFAFVEGTDPEILLIIEARRTAAGLGWQFAAARVNSIAMRVTHKGREVWSVPTISWERARDPREPYTLFIYESDDPGNPSEKAGS